MARSWRSTITARYWSAVSSAIAGGRPENLVMELMEEDLEALRHRGPREAFRPSVGEDLFSLSSPSVTVTFSTCSRVRASICSRPAIFASFTTDSPPIPEARCSHRSALCSAPTQRTSPPNEIRDDPNRRFAKGMSAPIKKEQDLHPSLSSLVAFWATVMPLCRKSVRHLGFIKIGRVGFTTSKSWRATMPGRVQLRPTKGDWEWAR